MVVGGAVVTGGFVGGFVGGGGAVVGAGAGDEVVTGVVVATGASVPGGSSVNSDVPGSSTGRLPPSWGADVEVAGGDVDGGALVLGDVFTMLADTASVDAPPGCLAGVRTAAPVSGVGEDIPGTSGVSGDACAGGNITANGNSIPATVPKMIPVNAELVMK